MVGGGAPTVRPSSPTTLALYDNAILLDAKYLFSAFVLLFHLQDVLLGCHIAALYRLKVAANGVAFCELRETHSDLVLHYHVDVRNALCGQAKCPYTTARGMTLRPLAAQLIAYRVRRAGVTLLFRADERRHERLCNNVLLLDALDVLNIFDLKSTFLICVLNDVPIFTDRLQDGYPWRELRQKAYRP